MGKDVTIYDNRYHLESYEIVFIQSFKDHHNLHKAKSSLTPRQRERIDASLRTGKSDLYKAFSEFVEGAPIHPEANKVVILDNLIWVMNQAKEDQDTNGVIKAIAEINKMIKGNLVSNTEKTVVKQQLVGIIDLTKKEDEPITIDV